MISWTKVAELGQTVVTDLTFLVAAIRDLVTLICAQYQVNVRVSLYKQ